MGKPNHLESVLRAALAVSAAKAQALQSALRQTQDVSPGGAPPTSLRRGLLAQIEALESALQYMGEGHPRRGNDKMRLEQLRILLSRWDQTLQVQQSLPKKPFK